MARLGGDQLQRLLSEVEDSDGEDGNALEQRLSLPRGEKKTPGRPLDPSSKAAQKIAAKKAQP